MKLLGILLFIGAGCLIAWVYYFFLRVSIAIWLPKKAKEEWLELVNSPMLAISYPFLKWIVPIWVILVPTYILISVVEYALLGALR